MKIFSAYRNLLFVPASITFLYFVFSRSQANWLYYSSLMVIAGGSIAGMIRDWKQGKRGRVKSSLLQYGAVAATCLLLYFIFER